VTQWQPIETVPKNERVLFVAFGEIVYAGEWNEWRKIDLGTGLLGRSEL
jgi:hypothetical protein